MAWVRVCAKCGTISRFTNRKCPSCKHVFGTRLTRAELLQRMTGPRPRLAPVQPATSATTRQAVNSRPRQRAKTAPPKPTVIEQERARWLETARAARPALPPPHSVRTVNGGRIESNRRRH
jgi:hypothetical protein